MDWKLGHGAVDKAGLNISIQTAAQWTRNRKQLAKQRRTMYEGNSTAVAKHRRIEGNKPVEKPGAMYDTSFDTVSAVAMWTAKPVSTAEQVDDGCSHTALLASRQQELLAPYTYSKSVMADTSRKPCPVGSGLLPGRTTSTACHPASFAAWASCSKEGLGFKLRWVSHWFNH